MASEKAEGARPANGLSFRHAALRVSCVLLFLAAFEVIVCVRYQGPSSGAENNTGFSAQRALAIHRQVFPDQPHPAGSSENQQVRDRIVRLLREQGWDVQVQEFPAPGLGGDESRLFNIAAVLPEQTETVGRPLLLCSHYDSSVRGPGAGDAGACVAAVLEAARILREEAATFRRPLQLLLTDGEELGLLGAAARVRHSNAGAEPPFVLNFDARGSAGPVMMYETHPANYEVVAELISQSAAPRVTGSLFTAVYRMMPNATDFTVFSDAGWSGLNFAIGDGAHRYHTIEDTFENLDSRSVQHFGDIMLSLARVILRADRIPIRGRQNAVFFDVLGGPVVVVPVSWSLPIGIGVCAAALLTAVRIGGTDRIPACTLRVGFLLVACIAAAALTGWLYSGCMSRTSLLPRRFVPHGHLLSLGLFLLTSLVVCTISWLALRRSRRRDVDRGMLVVGGLLTAVVAVAAPEFSHLSVIPVAGVAACLFCGLPRLVCGIVAATISGMLLVPIAHLISIALGPAAGVLTSPVYACVLLPLLPFAVAAPESSLTVNNVTRSSMNSASAS